MFHPSCARGVGSYMNTKTVGGKLQQKAYCLKHSLEQRAKVEFDYACALNVSCFSFIVSCLY